MFVPMTAAQPNRELSFLDNEIRELRAQWFVFRRLFVEGDCGDATVARSAPAMYGVVQRAILRNVSATLGRLFDRTHGAHALHDALAGARNTIENAAFERLQEMLHELDGAFVEADLNRVRNQILAHNDARVVRGDDATPQSNIGRIEDLVVRSSDWLINLFDALGLPIAFDEGDVAANIAELEARLADGTTRRHDEAAP